MKSHFTKIRHLNQSRFAILTVLASGVMASNAAWAAQPIVIRAQIDGRDQLIVQGETLQWHHFDFAAVGRHGGNSPTILETQGVQIEWLPEWPEPWPAQIRYEAFSSVLPTGITVLPAEASRWHVTKLSGRGEVHVLAQPSASNQYKLIVEFDDNAPIGSSFYSARLSQAKPVVIDLRPSDRSNVVTPGSAKTVQVAILSELLPSGFDATRIDPSSVRFGPYQAGPASFTLFDVNADERQDAIVGFPINATGISCGDSQVELSAITVAGDAIEGRDVVRTTACQ